MALRRGYPGRRLMDYFDKITIMTEKLKPCPFCGGTAWLSRTNERCFVINCLNCPTEMYGLDCGYYTMTKAEICEACNTRVG